MSTAETRAAVAPASLDAVRLVTGIRGGLRGADLAPAHPENTAFVLACMLDDLLPRIFADGGTEFLRRFALNAATDQEAGSG